MSVRARVCIFKCVQKTKQKKNPHCQHQYKLPDCTHVSESLGCWQKPRLTVKPAHSLRQAAAGTLALSASSRDTTSTQPEAAGTLVLSTSSRDTGPVSQQHSHWPCQPAAGTLALSASSRDKPAHSLRQQ